MTQKAARRVDGGPAGGRRRSPWRAVLRWLCGLVAAAVVSVFTFLLVTGRYSHDGPVVATVSQSHGLHAGDVVVLAGWLVAMIALAVLVVEPGRDR